MHKPEAERRGTKAVARSARDERRGTKVARGDTRDAFWLTKPLEGMSPAEWESLCDGCGRCCLVKLEDETGEIHHTDVGCTLLDGLSCRCRDYARRQARVPDCVRLTPEAVRTIPWLPPTCAYRLVRDGEPLYPWHPLVSGRRASVHEAGISVRGRVSGNEDQFSENELPDRIVEWPGTRPDDAVQRDAAG